MVRTEGFFEDRERALVEPLGLAVAALVPVENRQIVEACGGIGVVRTECFFFDRERTLEERLGFGVAALVPIELRQIVEICGGRGVVGTEQTLGEGQCLLRAHFRFLIFASVV